MICSLFGQTREKITNDQVAEMLNFFCRHTHFVVVRLTFFGWNYRYRHLCLYYRRHYGLALSAGFAITNTAHR